MTMDLSEIRRFASKFIGIPIDDFYDDEEQYLDSIVSEAVRYAITFNKNTENFLSPVHGNLIRNWVTRKTRSIIGGNDSEIKRRVTETISGSDAPNLELLGDIVRSPNGCFTPAISQAIKIKKSTYLLISGRPTMDFLRLGFRVNLNGVVRELISDDEQKINSMGISLIKKSDYLGNKIFKGSPREYLEFCVTSYPREKWVSTIFDESYLGNGIFSKVIPISIPVVGGTVTFWRTRLDFETMFKLQFMTNLNEKYSISILDDESKRIELAIDSILGKKRKAILYKTGSSLRLELNQLPPDPEVRWLFALGGIVIYSKGYSRLWKFNNEVEGAVRDLISNLWLDIVEVNGN